VSDGTITFPRKLEARFGHDDVARDRFDPPRLNLRLLPPFIPPILPSSSNAFRGPSSFAVSGRNPRRRPSLGIPPRSLFGAAARTTPAVTPRFPPPQDHPARPFSTRLARTPCGRSGLGRVLLAGWLDSPSSRESRVNEMPRSRNAAVVVVARIDR